MILAEVADLWKSQARSSPMESIRSPVRDLGLEQRRVHLFPVTWHTEARDAVQLNLNAPEEFKSVFPFVRESYSTCTWVRYNSRP
jgi:hypothetical protein